MTSERDLLIREARHFASVTGNVVWDRWLLSMGELASNPDNLSPLSVREAAKFARSETLLWAKFAQALRYEPNPVGAGNPKKPITLEIALGSRDDDKIYNLPFSNYWGRVADAVNGNIDANLLSQTQTYIDKTDPRDNYWQTLYKRVLVLLKEKHNAS